MILTVKVITLNAFRYRTLFNNTGSDGLLRRIDKKERGLVCQSYHSECGFEGKHENIQELEKMQFED